MVNPFQDNIDRMNYARVLDKFNLAIKRHENTYTDFFDAKSWDMFTSQLLALRIPDVSVQSFGGFEFAERRMIGFIFDKNITAPITPITITFNTKFSKPPTHRDYLGAVLGLGFDRIKIGDIRVADSMAVMYVVDDIADYICTNLIEVGRVKVTAKCGDCLLDEQHQGVNMKINVASLRVDAVLAAIFKLSRNKAGDVIDAEKVFVNWRLASKAQILSDSDILTIRGLGRVRIVGEDGRSKKDRIILNIIKY